MVQVYGPVWNAIARWSIPFAGAAVVGSFWLLGAAYRSDWVTRIAIPPAQPVQFSHRHHAGELGLDCRLCHDTVADQAFAGMPETAVCLICHRQVWAEAPELAPVRASALTGEPLRWRRVHDLPDHVYFHHGVHVRAGIGCAECHGAVERMVLVAKARALHMRWCVDCHRDAARQHGRDPRGLDDCQVCHR